MNEKEISEIRRRFQPEKSNILGIRGCLVNDQKEIVSQFNQSLGIMPEDESEKFLSIMKKSLSGTLDKNLLNIEFSTDQVVDSDEHRLLMLLRDSQLKDEGALEMLYKNITESISIEGSYLILLTYDSYDIPYRTKDGSNLQDSSAEMFSYILCSICPIKTTKPALSYFATENELHSRSEDMLVSPPEMAFMFPAFDDRSSNIYRSLYYTRSITDSHQDFVDAVFNREAPLPAAAQKEIFQEILGETLEEECSFETVQSLHGQLNEMIEIHKENKEEIPLTVSKATVAQLLHSGGVSDEHLEAFEDAFDEQFGAEMSLSPKNIVETKKTKIELPDIKIEISGEGGEFLETRVIDGIPYILIRADAGVELNGVAVKIPKNDNSDRQ